MTAEQLPDECTVDQVCTYLQISKATFYRLRKRGQLPCREVLPRLTASPRYMGADLRARASEKQQRRAALAALEHAS
jgi:predicted site-specific integrase-resolvase